MIGMFEPMHLEFILAGDVLVRPDYDRQDALAIPKAVLWRASALAIEGAFRFGTDLPVGASLSDGSQQSTGFFASDRRTGYDHLHAERYVLARSEMYQLTPTIMGVTMEPCLPCQSAINAENIKSCYFVLSRQQVAELGLVNDRPGLLDGPVQQEPPFYIQVTDPILTDINLTLLRNTVRDRNTGVVEVDRDKLMSDLCEFEQITPFFTQS
jgi:tRNA(Arg) A34 adenosine deaminase TadA